MTEPCSSEPTNLNPLIDCKVYTYDAPKEPIKWPHLISDVIAQVKSHPKYATTNTQFKESLERWNGVSANPYQQKKHNKYIRHVWSHFYNGVNYVGWEIYGEPWIAKVDHFNHVA